MDNQPQTSMHRLKIASENSVRPPQTLKRVIRTTLDMTTSANSINVKKVLNVLTIVRFGQCQH